MKLRYTGFWTDRDPMLRAIRRPCGGTHDTPADEHPLESLKRLFLGMPEGYRPHDVRVFAADDVLLERPLAFPEVATPFARSWFHSDTVPNVER